MSIVSLKRVVAAVLVGTLAGAPLMPTWAQDPAAQAPTTAPPTTQAPAESAQPVQSPTPELKTATQGGLPISLGVRQFDYSKPPSPFPNLINPYTMQYIAPGALANSPRLEQLIHNGKLELSLQDAIALAMENSMDIVVSRYNSWMADASILKTKAGGYSYGTPDSLSAGSTANVPNLYYDPVLSQVLYWDDRTTPINNAYISGTGLSGLTASALTSHTAVYNTTYSQSFDTGTSFNVGWDNTRSSSNAANFFNPYVNSQLVVGFQQQLLQGAGRFINRRNILIAENNKKISDLAFSQQAITTITNTITAYWELAYARQNVQVNQEAVTVAQKLYTDNKKQLEIGTMAPLDVTRAESELATDQQNLIVAQTTRLQDELVLKNYISKDPLASNLLNVEIIPTDKPDAPEAITTMTFEEAVKLAFTKRPDLQEQFYNVKNAEVDVKATKNALLPLATLTGQFGPSGLAGNGVVYGQSVVTPTGQPTQVPIVDANGNPVNLYVGGTTVTTPIAGHTYAGFGTAQSQIFHNNYPDYNVGLNFQLPLRNRAAQADNIHAQLTLRQMEAQMQQYKNSALLDVRNTTIAVEQGRAQVQAASKARQLQQETFDAEQKKYRLGASTVYNVILTQSDLITAQGTELRALANLAEAKANYERALGRTLEVNAVTIAGTKAPVPDYDPLIPGTVNGQVVGMDKVLQAIEKANGGGK